MKALRSVLSNCDAKTLTVWLERNAACPPDLASFQQTEGRKRAVEALLRGLVEQDRLLAKLASEARDVLEAANPGADWAFRVAADDERVADGWEARCGLDRSLWFFIHHPAAFERVLREISYSHFLNCRTKFTRFSTLARLIDPPNDAAIARLEDAIRDLWFRHDASGRHAVSVLDIGADQDGRDYVQVSVDLSRIPVVEPHFGDDGLTHDAVVRKVTAVQIRYEPETGMLFVAAERGGFPLRKQAAEAFAEIVLGQLTSPTIVKDQSIELGNVLRPEIFTAMAGDDFDEVLLVEIAFHLTSEPGADFKAARRNGMDNAFLQRVLGERRAEVIVQSARFRFVIPSGSGGNPRSKTVSINSDGTTSFDLSNPAEVRIRDTVLARWGFVRRGS